VIRYLECEIEKTVIRYRKCEIEKNSGDFLVAIFYIFMKFYIVTNEFINFLKAFDSKVPNNYYGKRPYIGVILTINSHNFFAPLTSYKEKQDRIKSSLPTIFKLHERTDSTNKLGMIQLNNMIPVLDSEINLLDIENQHRSYKNMLYKQYEFIKINRDKIKDRANQLYRLVVENKHKYYCKISCNFKLLEDNYQNYK
jgi:protein AbiQ